MSGMRKSIFAVVCILLVSRGAAGASEQGAAGAPEPSAVEAAGKNIAPERLQEMLGGLDPAGIPTGILYDRVVPLSRVGAHDGRESSPAAGLREWRQMYFEMRSASSTAPEWPTPGELDRLSRSAADRGAVPIAIMNFRYNRIREDAFEDGSLAIRGGRVVETGRDPYTTHRAFAVSALKDYTHRGEEVVFAFDRRLYLSNDGTAPRAIDVDFGDGLGYREAVFGHRYTVRYTQPGEKAIRARVVKDDGEALYGSFVFRVEHLQTPSPDDTPSVTASIGYNGQFGTGSAYVYLSGAHTAITNPVVVVEGFDLDNTMNWDELYQLLNQENLLENLRSEGFDAVVLNFTDATDYVQKNSFVVVELLQEIQAVLEPYHDIALVGGSMGGLCARYALAYMGTHAVDRRVRTFVSFDSPHKGANIPLGIQYWLDFFSGLSSDAAFLLSRLDRPAARQLLVYHHTTPPGSTGEADPLRAQMLSDFAAVGDYPTGLRNVAVANGSGYMQGQGFAPGDQIIRYEYSSLLVSITGNAWAVPNAASHIIFDGRIRIIVPTDQLSVTVSGTLPYDNAPGGRRNSMAQMDSTQAPYGDIVALYPSHCFVPAVSALDLATNDLFYDIAGDPDIYSRTPFDVVYYPAANQDHMTITAQTAAWLTSEIEAGATAVEQEVPNPPRLDLSPPYPNPLSESSVVRFAVPDEGPVTITIHDVTGRRVATLLDRSNRPAGSGWVRFDSSGFASGVYFVRMNAPAGVVSRKVTIVR